MGTLIFTGNADGVAQVTTCTPANFEPGDIAALKINNKVVQYTVVDGDTVATIVDGLVAAIGASLDPEWLEVTATDSTTHVTLTGPADGKPFTVADASSDAGNLTVTVTTIRDGSAVVNEKQLVTLPGSPTGGTFTLTFAGQTTGAIAYNASAATVETAFEGLSSVGAGNGTVSGSAGGPWTIEFTGSFAGTNVPLVTGDGTNLTGTTGYITHATTTQGAGGTNEKQTVTDVSLANGVPFLISPPVSGPGASGNEWESQFYYSNSTAAEIQTGLEATMGAGNVLVTGSAGGPWVIEFTGIFAEYNAALCELFDESLTLISDGSVTIAETVAGSASDINEVQTVKINHAPTGGTFTLTFQGQTTGNLTFDESAADMETALEALSNITDVTVTRSGSGTINDPYVFTITFVDPGGTDVQQMTSTPSLTGSGVNISTTQAGSAAVNEAQRVTVDSNAAGGTFTLTWDPGGGDETTGAIAYNASASTVQTALEGLATPTTGDFSVSGPSGGPYVVVFTGSYAATDVNEMTGSGASLTGGGTQAISLSTTTTGTGPNYWSNANNWSTGAVPVNSDDVYFQNSEVSCLYGLAQSAVTLASLNIDMSYTGSIGLPDYTATDYYEYRQKELTISATAINIGNGEGTGSQLIRLNTGSNQTAITVKNSGLSEDITVPSIQWVGTHASSTVTITKGEFGVAIRANEAATILTLTIGHNEDPDVELQDLKVELGPAVTLTTINKYGGTLHAYSGLSGNFKNDKGDAYFYLASACGGTMGIKSGTVYWNSSGTITGQIDIYSEGSFDARRDPRGFTITAELYMHKGSAFWDTARRVTWTASPGLRLVKCSLPEVILDVGADVRFDFTNI